MISRCNIHNYIKENNFFSFTIWVLQELSSVRNVESWGRWLGSEIDRSEGVPPRPYIFDCGALHVDMITACA
jgi:hypothetical protein